MTYIVFSTRIGHQTFIIATNMDPAIMHAAHVVWEYMQLGEEPGDAGCLLVLGSRDDMVARVATDLMKRYTYDHIVITGGRAHRNDLLATAWSETTEAAHFAALIEPFTSQELLLETEAQSTGENVLNSYRLLRTRKITAKTILIVTKPYMERRAKATFEAQWPDKQAHFRVASSGLALDTYVSSDQPLETVLHIVVGDLERILVYPSLGYQTVQHVPRKVLQAFAVLKAAGFTKHLLR